MELVFFRADEGREKKKGLGAVAGRGPRGTKRGGDASLSTRI